MTDYGVTNWYDDKPCPECGWNGVIVCWSAEKRAHLHRCESCGKTWEAK